MLGAQEQGAICIEGLGVALQRASADLDGDTPA
jgi:hypothetical protein